MSQSILPKIRSGSEQDRFASSYIAIPFCGCWIWARSIDADGYGIHYFKGHKSFAHRRSYELSVGSIPDGLFVCHRCDTPSCVNPGHLFLGTCKDNIQDALSKLRFGYGEANGRAKLSKADVALIRSGRHQTRELVALLGVTKTMINGIKRGAFWKHIA
jgi:hypothetical protein